MEVRIVDADGVEVPPGAAGEVVVRGYNVMSGYFGDAEATAAAVDAAGWLHTGDVGILDADGNLAITDRLKDMYVSGGFNVYPAEVEAVLRRHPAVGQVAVVGVPDHRMGEVGLAVVVPAAGADRASLAGTCRRSPRTAWPTSRSPVGSRWSTSCPPMPAARCSSASSGPPTGPEPADARHRRRRPPHRDPPHRQHDRTTDIHDRTTEQKEHHVRGIVYTGTDVEVTDQLAVGDPGPTEVRVAVGAAGVCHSDLSVINGTIPWKAPSVLGHEGAGVVEAVGSEVRSVTPGDHVVIATLASCGTCRACATGHPTWCVKTLGNVSTPFTYKGEPASNFAAVLGLRRVDHREGGPGRQDLEGRSADLGLPDRVRRADRGGCGAEPGQGAARGDGGGLRCRRGGSQRDPGPPPGRCESDHRRRHPGLEGGAGPTVRGHPLRGRLADRRRGRHP